MTPSNPTALSDLILPVTGTTLCTATQMMVGFVGALFVGARLLPGLERSGYPQPDGTTREYKLTGMTLLFVAHGAAFVAVFGFGVSLTPVVRHFWSLFAVANALAIAISLSLYARASRRESALRDLFLGTDLNPTWLGVDLKMFMYQPSLIGVNLLVVSFANAQHDLYGSLTPQMCCLLAFWWAYLFTHYVKEEFMLSTWDVIAENFGTMLVWGDLVYVPFLYSLPCWWVVDDRVPFSLWQSAALSFAYFVSLSVFRQANWQKERFKRSPNAPIWGKKPELVGGRLLASGWWGLGRKLNYTGEIGVYVCFALTAGFEHPWPYVLPLSLIVLLAQRAARDDRRCLAKYGDVWTTYCARARFRMIPFLY
jgi:delta14-sterol reductase